MLQLLKTSHNTQRGKLKYSPFCVLFDLGKLFKTPDLTLIIEFLIMFYKDKPIDWLLDHILWVKVCNPEKDAVSLFIFHSQ